MVWRSHVDGNGAESKELKPASRDDDIRDEWHARGGFAALRMFGAVLAALAAAVLALVMLPRSARPARAAAPAAYVFTSTVASPYIPDHGCQSGAYVTQTITVPNRFVLGKVRVGVNMTHPWRGDLFVRLAAPDGTSINVLNLGDNNANFNVLLDDDSPYAPGSGPGAGSHDTSAPAYLYTWQPAGPLAAFKLKNPAGAWQLSACDGYWGDVGRINSWSLFLDEDRSDYAGLRTAVSPAAPAHNGDALTISVAISNNLSRAGNVTLVDPVPVGTSYIPGSAAVSPSGGTLDTSSGRVAWSGTLAAGQSATLSFRATVTAQNGRITNTVTLSDPLALAAVPLTATNPVAAPDYSLSAISAAPMQPAGLPYDDPVSVFTSLPVAYTITVSNDGAVAGNASLNAPLPAGASFVPGSAASSSGPSAFDGASIVWNGNIAAGGRAVIRYQLTTSAVNGVLTHTATISDPLLAAPVLTTANPIAMPALDTSSLAASRNAVAVGERFTYTLVIRNSGLAPAASASAVAALPAGLQAAGAPAASAGTAQWSGALLLWKGSVPAGGSVSIAIPVVASTLCGSVISATAALWDAALTASFSAPAPPVQTYNRLILTEDFSSAAFPPAGWQVVRNSGNCDIGGADWYNRTGGQGGYALANSYTCGDYTTMDTELRSPAFSLAGIARPVLEFKYDYCQGDSWSQWAKVEISANGSAGPWAQVWKANTDQSGPRMAQLDLRAWAGQSNLMLRFHFSTQGWTYWWQFDDVRLFQVCPVQARPDQQGAACSGQAVTYTLAVANMTAADTIAMTYTAPSTGLWSGWRTAIQPAGLQLGAYSTGTVAVIIRVPWVDSRSLSGSDLVVAPSGAASGQVGQALLHTTAASCAGWQDRVPSPGAAADAVVVYANGYVYQIGGRIDGSFQSLGRVNRYDPAADTWQTMTALPTPAAGVDAAALNGIIYVPDGETSALKDSQTTLVQAYATATDRWTAVAPLPAPLSYYQAAALNGRLYVIGGFSRGAVTNTVYIYDPASNTWRAGAPMQQARIYIAGGYDGARTLDTLEIFTPDANGGGSELHLCAGEPVRFDALNMGGTPVDLSWDFGDGVISDSSTAQNAAVVLSADSVTHTYAAGGTYTVVLTASNGCGTVVVRQAVTAVQYALQLDPPVAEQTAPYTGGGAYAPAAAAEVTYTLRVTNSGNTVDRFTFSIGASGNWTTTLSAWSTANLAPGEGADVTASVLVPAGASGTWNASTIMAISSGSPDVYRSSTLMTLAPASASGRIQHAFIPVLLR